MKVLASSSSSALSTLLLLGRYSTTTQAFSPSKYLASAGVSSSSSHHRHQGSVTSAAMSSSSSSTNAKGVSSYLPNDTYNSLPKDGEVIFLHTMIRSMDLQKTMEFFEAIGLQETRRKDSEGGRFTLVFMASSPGAPEIEITYNWDPEIFAPPSRSMGHLAYGVDNIYELCDNLQSKGITILRPPRDGKMAFIKR